MMEAARLYESPFTDLTPQGPEALFTGAEVDELITLLASVGRWRSQREVIQTTPA